MCSAFTHLIGRPKNQHDLYSEERSQQANIPQHNITTIVEQQTPHIRDVAGTWLKWNL
jgi:hypothetical protein